MAAPSESALEGFPLILGKQDDRTLTQSLFAHVERKATLGWWALFSAALAGTLLLVFAIATTLYAGVGTWGNNVPVAWGFGIINLVWWIGIGHAGTLISAILLLFQQRWRTSINRMAEAMTLFAVMCAALFPALHLGRPWFAYWLVPYPSTMGVWPQFKSPLVWDVFAIGTYFTVSFLFWYVGLIPDLATLRDHARTRLRRIVYGIFSLGWRGSGRHWTHWRAGYLLLAGLATPLVLSVHTVISFDFAVSQLPGWHSTIFPPYFVAGAVFSGFAMVMTLMVPARKALCLEHVVTLRHLENMNKVILLTGLIVSYGYLTEHFVAWYGASPYERFAFANRAGGPYAFIFWTMLFCNVLVPQLFWLRWARRNLWVMWVASVLINVGMWSERFVIVVTSLHRDFLPSSWAMFYPTWVDLSLLFGTISFFGLLFLLFLRFVPAVAAAEMKELNHELAAHPAEAA
ncbi:MAG: polysulfide reductase NrfD [Myxococcales bacterium]|nr:polysulfide reductase NrfD [Myxococcales bacterium]